MSKEGCYGVIDRGAVGIGFSLLQNGRFKTVIAQVVPAVELSMQCGLRGCVFLNAKVGVL